MKSIRLLLSLVAMLALAAVGCGDDGGGSGSSSQTTLAPPATTAGTGPTTTAPAAPTKKLRVAVVTPSAENDVAFSQSMFDSIAILQKERGAAGIEIAKSPNLFVVADASAAIRDYATKGFDLVIAHGSQYGALLKEIAPQFPKVSFAWGTAADTFGAPNIWAYEAKSDQGGYVLGVLASQVTKKDNIGIIGPVEVGDAKLYVEGFKKGVVDGKSSVKANVTYTGSFSDVAKMAEAAKTFTTGGADVLTGSSQSVAGAIPVAEAAGAAWFGTQANQASLSKKATAASQVYRWEDTLRQIMTSVEKGTLGGKVFTLTLANKGLVIEYNTDYKLDAAARAKADAALKAVIDGTVKTTA